MASPLTIQPNNTAGNDCYGNDVYSGGDGVFNENYFATGSVNGGEIATFIKFDLSGVPAGATVTSATLSIYQYACVGDPGTHTLNVYRLKRATVETATTWNRYDGTNLWSTAGALGADDVDLTPSGSATENKGNGWCDITLDTTDVQEMVDGDFTNNGFKIYFAGMTGNNAPLYYSSDETTQTTLRPKLVIEYTEGTSVTVTPDALVATSVINDGTISTVRNISTLLSVQSLTASQPAFTVALPKNITVITTVQSLTASQPACTVYPLGESKLIIPLGDKIYYNLKPTDPDNQYFWVEL